MGIISQLRKIYCRLHYPVSLPEDVAQALGIKADNYLSFAEFAALLSSPEGRPTKLYKYMPRKDAEQVFYTALKKESFCKTSLFSYYFAGGWLGFLLHFDDAEKLRRLYLQHKDWNQGKDVEIRLAQYEEVPEHFYRRRLVRR